MEGVGWFGAILIGGLAGWLAGKFIGLRYGLFMNIFIGIVGAIVANAVFESADIHVTDGWLGFLITGFIGSCVLLFLAKIARR
jgi:uncharacterized membrane protein YeaQ/YmgE (transglycosylase-associated protein family)